MAVITCAMCGTHYDSSGHSACQSCPLHPGCSLTCCPACGYTGADPHNSTLLRWLEPLWRPGRQDRPQGTGTSDRLNQIRTGGWALVLDLGAVPLERRLRLEGLGLGSGQPVEILAQSPVTVIRVGHAQLALAGELSRLIKVRPLDRPPAGKVQTRPSSL